MFRNLYSEFKAYFRVFKDYSRVPFKYLLRDSFLLLLSLVVIDISLEVLAVLTAQTAEFDIILAKVRGLFRWLTSSLVAAMVIQAIVVAMTLFSALRDARLVHKLRDFVKRARTEPGLPGRDGGIPRSLVFTEKWGGMIIQLGGAVGLLGAYLLFHQGLITSRGFPMKVCFYGASFILLTEVIVVFQAASESGIRTYSRALALPTAEMKLEG